MSRAARLPRVCRTCGKDISHRHALSKFCSTACTRKADRQARHEVSVRRDLYEALEAEAKRRGTSPSDLLEELLRLVLVRGEA